MFIGLDRIFKTIKMDQNTENTILHCFLFPPFFENKKNPFQASLRHTDSLNHEDE